MTRASMVKSYFRAYLRGSAGIDQGYRPYLPIAGAKTKNGLGLGLSSSGNVSCFGGPALGPEGPALFLKEREDTG